MKLRYQAHVLIFFLCSILCSGCLHSYEENAVGTYSVNEYELIDSNIKHELPKLTLKKDKTFSLEFINEKHNGNWNIDDIQEFTLIHFKFEDGHIGEGRIDSIYIDILNSDIDFYMPNLKSLLFKKVKPNN